MGRSSSVLEVEELSISSCPEHSKLLDDDDIISNRDEKKSETPVPRLEMKSATFWHEFFSTRQCSSDQSQHLTSNFLRKV